MTFQEYLMAHKNTYDVEGDVVRLIRSREQMLDITSRGDLQEFLVACGASTFTILAAESLWAGYVRQGSRDTARARRSRRTFVANG